MPVVAAGVAFYLWLALIPGLIAAIMIYGLVVPRETIMRQIESLTADLPREVASVVSEPIQSATSIDGLGIGALIALAAVLWSASGGLDGLIKGINIAYDEDARSFLKRRGMAILLTIGALVFLGVAVGLITGVPLIVSGLAPTLRIAAQIGSFVLLAALMMAALAVLYRIAPNRDDPRLRWLSPGAVFATLLWLVGSAGFFFYVRTFGNYNQTYGALAGVIVVNLWLFLSAFCVLFGAEINSETEAQTRTDTTRGEPRPMGRRDAVKADRLGDTADERR